MNSELAVHLGWMFAGSVWAFSVLHFHRWIQRLDARDYFRSLHGEAVNFPSIADRSSFFLGRVVELERMRIVNSKAKQSTYFPVDPLSGYCENPICACRSFSPVNK